MVEYLYALAIGLMVLFFLCMTAAAFKQWLDKYRWLREEGPIFTEQTDEDAKEGEKIGELFGRPVIARTGPPRKLLSEYDRAPPVYVMAEKAHLEKLRELLHLDKSLTPDEVLETVIEFIDYHSPIEIDYDSDYGEGDYGPDEGWEEDPNADRSH